IKHFLQTFKGPAGLNLHATRCFVRKVTHFFIPKDTTHLYRRNSKYPPFLVVLDSETRLTLLQQAHKALGHRGVQAVFETLRRCFFWPKLRGEIQHHVCPCLQCQL
ncbi:hypothetical protein B0H10DRAFT_1651046, partial [Mycena sp. CBHHK59/15]